MPPQPCQPTLLYVVTVDWWFVLHRMHIAEAARDAGYRVVIATLEADHGDVLRAAGFRVVPLALARQSLGPLRLARELWSLVSIYRRERPDIVHHLAIKPSVLGTAAARLAQIRFVVNNLAGLGTVFTDPPSRRTRLLRRAILAAFRLAFNRPRTRTIVENSDDRALVTERAGVRPARVVLIPSIGVDPGLFPASPEPPGVPVVTMAARLIRPKGVADFVAAARLLRSRGVAVRMQLVGAPDPASPGSVTERELAAWVAEGSVEWPGWRSDMSAVWAASTLAVLPTYYREGVPVSLLEAASTGRAIVATDMPGCRDVVVDGVTGTLVAPRRPDALADAIEDLLADPARREAMGRAGRERVLERFTRTRLQDMTTALYAELRSEGQRE